MNVITELYQDSLNRLPKTGQHILAFQTENQLVVYQAYKPAIANYAVKHQILGGPDFSYQRMSWIKPNFLWMMYRCGWASKKDQERVLALWIEKEDFEKILDQAAFSSFNADCYASHDEWKNDLEQKDVRLQWDPDHDPFGGKLTRRAIQLGLKNTVLENFGKRQIQQIDDITEFVQAQKQLLDSGSLGNLSIPLETVFKTGNGVLNRKLGLS